jgi:hypothetical protein
MDHQSIGRQHVQQFFETSLDVIEQQRDFGLDVLPVLFTLIAGHEAHLLEPKFIAYFSALEGLVSLHDGASLVANATKKNIRKDIERVLDSHPDLGDAREWIKAKIPELWRSPLRERVVALLKRYDIVEPRMETTGIEGVYHTRNRIVHTTKDVDIERLILHTYLVRDVVEKVLIKMLGCSTELLVQWYSPAWSGSR